MTYDFPRSAGADVRTHGVPGSDHDTVPHTAAERPAEATPVRNPSVDAEYAASEAGQRHRVQAAATQGPAPTPDAGANPQFDFSRIGAAFVASGQMPPQMIWVLNDAYTAENSVNTVLTRGREQGGISDEQIALNQRLARAVVQAGNGAPLQLTPADLAVLLQASGLPFEWQDPNQLVAATRYINTEHATIKTPQEARIAKALHGFHILHNIGHPQVERQQMLDLLWGAATVPGHAFRKADDSELAASYQQIAAALNGPPGEHKIALEKHNLEFTTNEAGQVTDTDTDRTHSFGMQILSAVLTIGSFIPVIGVPCAIANGALQAYQGIKNGDLLQAVAGVAGAFAGGASAIAGAATKGAAATTARIAEGVSKATYGLKAGIDAYQTGDLSALVSGGLQIASGVAGAVGKGADAVARTADNVAQWADRVLIGKRVVVDFRNGNYAAALASASALAGEINGELGGASDGRGARAAEYLGYGAFAAQAVQNLQAGNYNAALAASQALVSDIGNGIGDDRAQPQWAMRANEYVDYARVGLSIEQAIRNGDYDAALAASQVLVSDIGNGVADDRAQPQWATRTSEYIDYARVGLDIEQAIRRGDYDAALVASQVLVGDIGNGIGDDRAQPQWATRSKEYIDYARVGLSIREYIQSGDYAAALAASRALSMTSATAPTTGKHRRSGRSASEAGSTTRPWWPGSLPRSAIVARSRPPSATASPTR